MGRISTDVDGKGKDFLCRGGAILESRIEKEERWGKGKIETSKAFSLLLSLTFKDCLLFCFLCNEFPRNQI